MNVSCRAPFTLNYKAEPLANIARGDLDAGKELIDVGVCCPTLFTTGSLVNLLKQKISELVSKRWLTSSCF